MAFDIEGAKRAGYSEKEIAEHLATRHNFNLKGAVDAGYSYGDVINRLASTPSTQKQEEQPSILSEAGRQIGIGARGILEGIGSIPEALIQRPFIAATNALLGTDYEASNLGRGLADAASLPTPETDAEKLAFAFNSGAGAILPTLGAGSIPAITAAAPRVASVLSASPMLQMFSGGTGALASESARQGGADETGQLVAGLAGGFAPGVASVVGSTGARIGRAGARAIDALTDQGRRRIAAENLRDYASDPNAVIANLRANSGEMVPGVKPTLAQVGDDPKLAVIEKGRANMADSLLGQRYMEQGAARQAELNDIAAALDERALLERGAIKGDMDGLSSTGGVDHPDAVFGEKLRGQYDAQYGAAKQRTRDAYANVDPQGTASFDLAGLRNDFDSSVSWLGRYAEVPPRVSKILGQMDNDLRKGVNSISYSDLQSIRTQLGSMSSEAERSGDRITKAVVDDMRSKIDKYVDDAGTYGIGISQDQANAFKSAKQVRREQAEAFEEGANKRMSRNQVADSAIPSTYFKSGAKGKDSMADFGKAYAGSPEAQDTMRDYIVQSFRKASTDGGNLSAKKMEKWLSSYGDALSEVPGVKAELQGIYDRQLMLERSDAAQKKLYSVQRSGNAKMTDRPLDDTLAFEAGFTPEEADRFRALQAETARKRRTDAMASVKGSPTAQNFATQAIIDSFMGKSLGRGGSGGGFLGRMLSGPVNRATELIYGRADDQINQILNEAFLEPRTALELMTQYKTYKPNVAYGDILRNAAKAQIVPAARTLLSRFETE